MERSPVAGLSWLRRQVHFNDLLGRNGNPLEMKVNTERQILAKLALNVAVNQNACRVEVTDIWDADWTPVVKLGDLLRRIVDEAETGEPFSRIERHCHFSAVLDDDTGDGFGLAPDLAIEVRHCPEIGAAGLPFAVFRGYIGADLKKVNPNIKSVTCPFTGEELAAVPALNPDVGIIHAQKANENGDVLIEGILGAQKEVVLASKRSIVTVEEVVPNFDDVHPNACVLPHWAVGSIAVIPGGAHPSYAHGYYKRDNATYLAWDPIAADRDTFLAWMEEHVMSATPAMFAGRANGNRVSV